MRREVRTEDDLAHIGGAKPKANGYAVPEIFTVADLLKLDVPAPEMLFEGMAVPTRGASLVVGAAKSGKTLLAVQQAIAMASGTALFGCYKVLKAGGSLIVEQDDPAGAASIKDIVKKGHVKSDVPLHVVQRLPFGFGPALLEWIERQTVALSLRLVILDSYTALRGPRGPGIDIVKAEQNDLMLLDTLAKRLGIAILIIHHSSKGSAALDWSEKAAGTFAMAAATEAQIHVSRFADLDSASPERLVRVRGRHGRDLEMVLRFQEETLNYEHVLDGGAAMLFPLLLQLKNAFESQTFGPKEFSFATGVSRATATRWIDRLCRADAIQKRGYGEYAVKPGVL